MRKTQVARVFGIVDVLARKPVTDVISPTQIVSDGLVFDLPAPPSINRAGAEWRLGNKASKVMRWRKAADAHLVYTGQHRKLGNPFESFFTIAITWDRSLADELHSDIDNRIKYLLDYLQHLRLFTDDGLCRAMKVGYGNIPDGCRVQLWEWNWES